MIPYGRQEITQEDIDAVIEVLRSDFLTQGPKVPEFERTCAKKFGASHAVAVNSATSALHIACMALELGASDTLWTSAISFVASANCGLYCGAHVDFVDIDPNTQNLCVRALEEKLIIAEQEGRLPSVLVAVHLCGHPCDMQAIHALGTRYNFKIIEDASHAVGSKYKKEYVGGCKYSDITIFSFHPVKIITTAEGGIALTNDQELATKMDLFRSHGVTRDPSLMTGDTHGPWYYQQIALGYNYRMTELQAALGLSQIKRLDGIVDRRRKIAMHYDSLLKDFPVVIPRQDPDCDSARHLYVIRIDPEVSKKKRKDVFEYLRKNGVGVNVHYIPIHLQPYFQSFGFAPGDYPKAEKYYDEAISLPVFPALTDEMLDKVVGILGEALLR